MADNEIKNESNSEEKTEVEDKKLQEVKEQEPDDKEPEIKEVKFEVIEKKDLPGSIKEYKVKVPFEEYDRELSEILKDLKSSVAIEGFRTGKAPLKLIKIRFGEDAQNDAVNKLIPGISKKLIEDESLNLVREPEIKDKKIEGNEPLEIILNMEVNPTIELNDNDYKNMTVEIEKEEIDDKKVTEQIEALRLSCATFEPKKTPDYKEGDAVVVEVKVTDSRGRLNKELSQENVLMQNPKTSFPETVANAFKGKKKGDSFEVEVENKISNRRGEILSENDVYNITIRDVREKILPNLTDEFAKDLGEFKSIDEVKKRIREDLEKRTEEHLSSQKLSKAYDLILEKVKIDPPQTLVEMQKMESVRQDVQRFSQMGIDLSAVTKDKEKYMESKTEEAKKAVQTVLLLQSIAGNEKIEVNDEDVNKEIERIAEESGRKPLAIRAALEARKEFDSFKDNLLYKKVTDFLLENVEVKYILMLI